VWEAAFRNQEKVFPVLQKSLEDFQRFNGCSTMEGLKRFENRSK
jgi:hypothetical protein